MRRFKNILCRHSKSEDKAALDRAVRLAKDNDAQLTVVEVVESISHELSQLSSVSWKDIQMQHSKRLEQLVAPIRQKGLVVKTRVLQGIPSIVIIQEVLRRKYDLVIHSASAKKGIKELFFGSVATQLMRKCPCPVWVIKSTQRKPFAKIMAAIDPAPRDVRKNRLNKKILDLAASLAELEKSQLHVVHAWSSVPNMFLSHGHMAVGQDDIKKISSTIQNEQRREFTALLESYQSRKVHMERHFVRGVPELVIPDLARRKQIDLVVMGTICRTGVTGFIIGNTAEELLPRLNCSLLTLKPDGFRTPVKLK